MKDKYNGKDCWRQDDEVGKLLDRQFFVFQRTSTNPTPQGWLEQEGLLVDPRYPGYQAYRRGGGHAVTFEEYVSRWPDCPRGWLET